MKTSRDIKRPIAAGRGFGRRYQPAMTRVHKSLAKQRGSNRPSRNEGWRIGPCGAWI
jgi:hypothetical protein